MIKLLILDRGFIDGKNITRCKQEWGIDVLLPMKRKMDIWEDAWALGQQSALAGAGRRQLLPPKPSPPQRPEAIVRREAQTAKDPGRQEGQGARPRSGQRAGAHRDLSDQGLYQLDRMRRAHQRLAYCARPTPTTTRTSGP